MQIINLTLHREILEEIEGENIDFPCANRNNLIFASCVKILGEEKNMAPPPHIC